MVKKWQHLRDVPLNFDYNAQPVEMLIGQNVPDALTPERVVRGGRGQPYAVFTALGWTVQGPVSDKAHLARLDQLATAWTELYPTVEPLLTRMFYFDFDDAYDFSNKGLSQEDRQWIEKADASMRRHDGHFVIDLPLRPGAQQRLGGNRDQALQRMKTLKRKFELDGQFQRDYKAFIQKMIDAGHVELVPSAPELTTETARVVNYVPHHGVYHPKKPGKIRVVFNCASKFRGTSLNDCLISGPDLTNSLIAVLLRFRQHQVAFMADVEAMFYQVLVPEHQRDALRFLWWPGGDVAQEPVTYRMKVHLFGATSSPSVANFALRKAATEAREAGLVNKDTEQTVHRNFYVDDCLKSTQTEEEAVETAKALRLACSQGGFRLTKFVSTSASVLKALPPEERAPHLSDIDLCDDKLDPLGSLQERVLGVTWSITEDCFQFQVNQEPELDKPATKRSILSSLSKVYDPLGIAAPVVITARILFRALTRNKQGWDDHVEAAEAAKWMKWIKELEDLSTVRVPRCLQSGNDRTLELHAFCDASTEAYSSVIFLREQGEPTVLHRVTFVAGKARVSPPKVVTIPRLELAAAKMAAELSNFVLSTLELKIRRRVYWSDSEVVLKYIRNKTKRFHTYVANRVESILALTEEKNWRYVPSELNPADLGSRGIPAKTLEKSIWVRGPEFLAQEESLWHRDACHDTIDEDDPEVKSQSSFAAVGEDERSMPCVERWAERYSSAYRLRKSFAIWSRLRRQLLSGRSQQGVMGAISVIELKTAERGALAWLQRETWPQAFASLGRLDRISELKALSPMISDGVIMMQTRTGSLLPVVPPGHFSALLMREAHEKRGHMGRQATMSEIRQNYWLIDLNRQVRRLIKECALCQRNWAPLLSTRMSALPDFRATQSQPFETTGVDYFGPFFVLQGQERVKMYGVIFTCASSRAVHLEVAENLSSSSFINALRRFACRRGRVKRFISDNGTNFAGAKAKLDQGIIEELAKSQDSGEVHQAMRKRQIDWSFNPPGASHYGGFFERLIGITRRCLAAFALDTPRTPESLMTTLCECKAVLNSRPLTTCSDDPADLEPLTPNHLILGNAGAPVPAGRFERASRALRNQWRTVQTRAEQFWKRWRKEYLQNLYLRSKWLNSNGRPLKENDVVLVMDPSATRCHWPLGRVKVVHPSKDGEMRVVEVQTKAGELTRPITKLCLLETASQE